jgi:membrane-bound metal-dependent hydrolase YbcI (DUF457 family)
MFLDLAFGIIVSIIAGGLFKINQSGILVPVLIFSILPDLDFVIYKIFGIARDKGYKHRELFHAPLLYLPLGTLAILFLAGKEFAICFLLVSILHFLHDSIAYGRGVAWLYPFSRNGYAFVYEYSRAVKKGLWQKVFVFDKGYTEYFDRMHGDEDWIRNIYFKLHPIAIVELAAFFLAIAWLAHEL